MVLAQLPGNFQAGHIGEMDVEEGGIDVIFMAVVQRSLPGLEDLRIETLASQQDKQGAGDDLIIIDHEYSSAGLVGLNHGSNYMHEMATGDRDNFR